jgi:flagellar assembly protein FliH
MTYALEQLEPSAPPPADSAAGILAQATAESERIRTRARAEGHAEGLAQGHSEGLAEARSAGLALGQALADARSLRERIAQETERDAVELALALAAKVLGGALEVQPERVLDVVRGALRRFADRRRVTVLVDPADLEATRAALAELASQAGGVEHCEVQGDRRVGRGGAIVRTVESEVDATVATQLERAREVVAAELGGQGAGRNQAGTDHETSEAEHDRGGNAPHLEQAHAVVTAELGREQ